MSVIEVMKKGPVAELVLNRPEALNVLNDEMAYALKDATADLKDDKSIACVVIYGAGGHFMGGGDIAYFKRLVDAYAIEGESAFPSDLFENLHTAIRNIVSMDKPVIVKVKGAVAGFGLSLMLAGDMVVAADNCVLSVAYCKIGATPDGGMSYFLPRAVGYKKAMELALTGARFTSQEAQNWGMINKVVAVDELDDETQKLANSLVNGPRDVLARTKQLFNQSYGDILNKQLDDEAANFAESMLKADFAEGVTAFCEKRKAVFNKD